jgi:hypothetical protein
MADGHALSRDQRLQRRGEQSIHIADPPSETAARAVKDTRVLAGWGRVLAGSVLAVQGLQLAAGAYTALRVIRYGLHPRLRLHLWISALNWKVVRSDEEKHDTIATREYDTTIV